MDRESPLEWRRLSPDLKGALIAFFEGISAEDRTLFHPHPFDRTNAERIVNYGGKDLYYALVDTGRVLSYGLLRGWDEGYAVPSLGIFVRTEARGRGIGELTMRLLHLAAQQRGAAQVRLTVYRTNRRAI